MTAETLGSYLRREREFRDIPLVEIAEATRIPLTHLNALEQDDFTDLPAATFIRGYLKAYATHIGLDAADLLLRFEQYLEEEGLLEEKTSTDIAVVKSAWEWKWKYLWSLLVASGLIALAAFLSRL